MQRILILTQYYPPETGAPQNRLSSLAKHLKSFGKEVSVLTAVPNYPQMEIYDGYKARFYLKEEREGIIVHRGWLYISKSKTVFSRLLNYFSFVFSAFIIGLFKIKRNDVIICESPPLFLGITAVLLKWIKRSKLIFNVSDLWPESAEELGIITNRNLLRITKKLEESIYKRSALITGQTQGIVKDIKDRFPNKNVIWIPNGIELSQFNPELANCGWRNKNGFADSDFIILYGGVLGYAQNLEVILKAAKILENEKSIKFIIVGDGPNKENLLEQKHQLGLGNVFFLPLQLSSQMPEIIKACDAGVIPLRNIKLFKGAIPSKIFEYLIFQKPILLGVDGEAKELFITKGKCGLFFTPQEQKELAINIMRLKNDTALLHQLGLNGEKYVRENFNRQNIAEQYNLALEKL
jgi:glycosyltransferase involved in cell wall biosynthesis